MDLWKFLRLELDQRTKFGNILETFISLNLIREQTSETCTLMEFPGSIFRLQKILSFLSWKFTWKLLSFHFDFFLLEDTCLFLFFNLEDIPQQDFCPTGFFIFLIWMPGCFSHGSIPLVIIVNGHREEQLNVDILDDFTAAQFRHS